MALNITLRYASPSANYNYQNVIILEAQCKDHSENKTFERLATAINFTPRRSLVDDGAMRCSWSLSAADANKQRRNRHLPSKATVINNLIDVYS